MADISYPTYLFFEGTNYKSYEFFGANVACVDGKYHYTFRVWAPNATEVGLISDFSGWEYPVNMKKITESGIFELVYVSDYSLERKPYKFRIFTKDECFVKGDPYARFSRGGWDGASLIFAENHFAWSDTSWMQSRGEAISRKGDFLSTPMNVYELHLGSYIRHFDNKYYSYTQLAEILPTYLKKMGYTHVEFMPIQEYPFDGSWGYQVCGFFAPTSRFGDPDEFRHLIDVLHKAGIGVILDWVCAHFPNDEWGLHKFDGSHLYEYSDQEKREAKQWGTSFFDIAKPEIQSFLISNALYFLREFHIDGLRVDAVSSMLYLDNERATWSPNRMGGRENLDGIEFFKKLSSAISSEFPDVLIIAEESTSYNGITSPINNGGLGFDLKWNMGWANDFFEYTSTDPIYRVYHHKALNFPLMYAFREKYCMPISHDIVCKGKQSFIGRMFGNTEDKFLMARLSLMLMMTYPGKKLTFMGTEFAQFAEWDHDRELEWFMLSFERHRAFKDYVSALNHFYLSTPELWQIDFREDGFKWIYPDEAEKNLVAFKRISSNGSEIVIAMNFSGIDQRITIPAKGKGIYNVMFDTGNYIGSPHINIHNSCFGFYADVTLPKYCGVIMKETQNENYF